MIKNSKRYSMTEIMAIRYLLDNLSDERAKEFRANLKKENSEAYDNFLEMEKILDKT